MSGKFTIQQTRTLVLSLLVATALVTGGAYFVRSQRSVAEQTAAPERVPSNVTQSEGFTLSKSEQGRTLFTVRALRAREQKDSGKSLLEDVEIITYGAQGNRHDRISSKLCEYDAKTGRVHSQGEVEIELATLPGELPTAAGTPGGSAPWNLPGGRAARIFVKTSGLTFEEKTGIASTDRAVHFRFSRGTGQATGAVYDSHHRTLRLKSAVEIMAEADAAAGQPSEERPAPVEIKAQELLYLQRESQIRLARPEVRRVLPAGGSRELTAAQAVLALDAQNQVRTVEVSGTVRIHEAAPGARPGERRDTRLAADRAQLVFNNRQALDQAYAIGEVQLDSETSRGRSEARAARAELFFAGLDNTLSQVEWKGGVRMVFTPTAAGALIRVLTSEAVEMFLKPGGRELDKARTLAPGRLELLPAAGAAGSGGMRRVLTADRFWMQFAEENQLRVLRAEDRVRLESEIPPPASGARNREARGRPPAPGLRVTTSDALTAQFGASQQLETLEQTGNFRYTEGEQQATAERAFYAAAQERVTLTGRAGRNPEVWDASTRTSARQITLDQKTNEGLAEGDVRSTHLAEEKPERPVPGPLSAKEPAHVIAERMVSNSRTGVTRYEGGPSGKRVRLWQKEDLILARTLVLEREERRMTAEGEVVTVLVESAAASSSQRRQPVWISAERMVYTDHDRRARYERRVLLRRQDSTTTAALLDAYLLPAEQVKPGQSRLERALARGNVEIQESSDGKVRRAAAELAEYLSAEEKMILSGGEPYLFDEQRGYTRGRQLTYYIRDDRIFVHGDGAARAVTEHRVTTRR